MLKITAKDAPVLEQIIYENAKNIKSESDIPEGYKASIDALATIISDSPKIQNAMLQSMLLAMSSGNSGKALQALAILWFTLGVEVGSTLEQNHSLENLMGGEQGA